MCDKAANGGKTRAPTIRTSYIWQVSGNLSALRMIKRLEADCDGWDGQRWWIVTAKRSRREEEEDGQREMSKLKFSQVIRTLPATRAPYESNVIC